MDERDPKTGDEKERVTPADVEGHRHITPKTVPSRTSTENDEPGTETPDVEAHRLVSDKTVPSKTVPQ